jgi:hypothetical protein
MWLNIGAVTGPSLQTPTKDSWQAGNYVSSSDATNWLTTINNALNLTDIQLEAGSVATPFERRSYGQELALCQRYYQQSTQVTTSWGSDQAMFSGNVSSGGSYMASVRFPVQMRASPAVTMLVPSTSPVSFPATAPSVSASNNQGILVSAVANATNVGSYVAGWIANAEL